MLKILGGVCLAALVLCFSFRKAEKIRLKTEALREAVSFVKECRDEIRYCRTDRTVLLKQACVKYPLLFSEEHKCLLIETDRAALSDFTDQLGASDPDGQIALCERYGAYFDTAFEQCEAGNRSLGKTYRMLGIFGAAATVLLFL